MGSAAGTCCWCIAQLLPLTLIFYKFCPWKIDFWVAKNISRLAYGHPRISSYLGMSLMYLERPLAAQILLIPTEKGLKIQQIATKG